APQSRSAAQMWVVVEPSHRPWHVSRVARPPAEHSRGATPAPPRRSSCVPIPPTTRHHLTRNCDSKALRYLLCIPRDMGATDSRSSFSALLPEQFGKYSLLGHLATGGMAEVWLARQLGMQGFEKIVVIKRARPELNDPETTALFLDEARLVATLEHPNIAQVYEIGAVNGS